MIGIIKKRLMNILHTLRRVTLPKMMSTTQDNAAKGYHTFFGVYLPSVLSIFGVIMYLRLGWIVGNLGVPSTLFIIIFSSSITLLTGFSISATATNMPIGGGGAYYMISRSFGPELGSAIGVFLFLSQATAIAFYIEGFSESIRVFVPFIDPTLVETMTLSALTILVSYSTNIALKTQLFIFLIILLTLVSIFFGSEVPSAGLQSVHENTLMRQLPFWGAFAIFFPAVTGIEAGFSMSGELKNPRRSLPLGTITAVISGLAVYSLLTIVIEKKFPEQILKSDYLYLQHYSPFPFLIVIGIWGATLSSALGGLMGAPRTLQALSHDQIFPKFLGRGFGKAKEPRIATALTFLIAAMTLYFGNINMMSPILSMFFLISYGMLNLAAGLEGLLGNPSWRPTFRLHWSVSMLGAVLCLFAMLMINPLATFIAIILISFFWRLMKNREISSSWEDIRQGIFLFLSRFAVYRLADLGPSARSWRPNFLVFTGSPSYRPYLLSFADAIAKSKGFLTTASIFTSDTSIQGKTKKMEETLREYLLKNKIQALVEVETAKCKFEGIRKMILNYGMGPIAPNTILLGDCAKPEHLHDYITLIFAAHSACKNVIIIKENENQTQQNKSSVIDIWWDDDSRKNSEFMVVLAHMLKSSALWRSYEIEIKSCVSHEAARMNRQTYFRNFFEKSRIKVNSKVLVLGEQEESIATTFKRFSPDSAIVFLGLRQPEKGESIEAYGKYFQGLLRQTKSLSNIAFVMCVEDIELNKIFG